MPKQNTTSSPVENLSFEAATAELETIVAQMESGNLTLEQSLQAYTRGAALIKHCQQSLSAAEQQIQILNNNQTLTPFEVDNE